MIIYKKHIKNTLIFIKNKIIAQKRLPYYGIIQIKEFCHK